MGFNNGYDAGWQDCELQNRAKWEKAAAEKALANAPSAPALDLGALDGYDVGKLFSTESGVAAAYLATLDSDKLAVLDELIGSGGAGSLTVLITEAATAAATTS